jgi:hypothetical protein
MVHLRIGAGVLIVLVVGASACHRPGEYQPTSATNPSGFDPATILAVTPNPASVPADGLSRSTIEAKIAADATVRHITFQTSLGTLSSGGRRGSTRAPDASQVPDAIRNDTV